ncbi:unnamed protein product [Blumeria hordei]|uniref:DUF1941 family protein n=1 Tax=Blumeria hordei TaxID=2867405 RepID=A0A383V0D0_BLUHO|nr:unnamed protein product [Blumeria hordei]
MKNSEPQQSTPNHGSTAGSHVDDVIKKMSSFLQSKDDTSKFVGLALLKTILDKEEVVKDSAQLQLLWEMVPPSFLDRLLRAQVTEKISQAEARSMVDLAVSVLHIFVVLLSDRLQLGHKLTGRTAALVRALASSTPESTKLNLQILLTIVSDSEGSSRLLGLDSKVPLIEVAKEEPRALDIFQYAWVNVTATADGSGLEIVRASMEEVLPQLLDVFKGTEAVTLSNFISNLLSRLDQHILPRRPQWLTPLVGLLRKLVLNKPTTAVRTSYTKLAANLLLAWPEVCPSLLFGEDSKLPAETKCFAYFFINLLLIDLRSSFASLLSMLNDDAYLETSPRLAAAFDIISSFIGYLMRSLDNAGDHYVINITPDQLLKLRKDMAETMSLTIEYLRDRWDASVAGAAGLHPSARDGTAMSSRGARLTLTWDSLQGEVRSDGLVCSGLRALALWLHEDDNDRLRSEAAGLMDMLLDLYDTTAAGPSDLRFPIVLALEGVVGTDDGLDEFVTHAGWQVLAQDLAEIIRQINGASSADTGFLCSEARRGLQIVRVLLAVTDHPQTGTVDEAWMDVVKSTIGIKVHTTALAPLIEFQIAALQLALALLSQVAGGRRKRFVTSYAPLSGLETQLRRQAELVEDVREATELLELLDDCVAELCLLR